MGFGKSDDAIQMIVHRRLISVVVLQSVNRRGSVPYLVILVIMGDITAFHKVQVGIRTDLPQSAIKRPLEIKRVVLIQAFRRVVFQ